MTGLKWLRRRFGISARQVAIRAHVPWYVRAGGAALLAAVIGAAGWWAYGSGQRFAGFDRDDAGVELARLTERVTQLEKENAQLRSEQSVSEREAQIERAAKADLARQVKTLAGENAALKEDLALFQSLAGSTSKVDAVSVSRVEIEPDAARGEYRYRVVVLQTGARARPFEGRLQLVVSLGAAGRSGTLTVPETDGESAAPHQLSFRIFQRVDGAFRVPADTPVRSVQVRVFEKGQNQPRVTHTVTLS